MGRENALFLRQGIFAGVIIQLFEEGGIAFFQFPQGLVGIHIVLVGIQNADGDIGAVVGGVLRKISPDDPASGSLHPVR